MCCDDDRRTYLCLPFLLFTLFPENLQRSNQGATPALTEDSSYLPNLPGRKRVGEVGWLGRLSTDQGPLNQ